MLVSNALDDQRIIDSLNNHGVGVIPTDTVYGLVCLATDKQAVSRLYKTKHRYHKPGTVIAASLDQLVELGLKRRYLKPVAHYWPGPISIIIPSYELVYIHQGVGSIAVRIPSDSAVTTLLQESGPLLTTSANNPAEPPATTIRQAQDYFGDAIDFYVDGGDISGRQSSTIIRIVDDAVEVLRQGAVIIKENGDIKK